MSSRLLVAVLLLASCRLPPAGHRTVRAAIGPEGGVLATTWGVALSVPPGALNSVVIFSIGDALDVPEGSVWSVEIGPSGTQFQIPATLYLTVPEGEVFPGGLKLMTVVNSHWVPVPGQSRDPMTREISGSLIHLSPYGLAASEEVCTNGLDDDGDGATDCDDLLCAAGASCSALDGGESFDGGEPLDGGTDDAGTPDGGYPSCQNDNQCGSGMVCFNLSCIVPAETDGGLAPCHTDNQCPANWSCLGGFCVSDPDDGGEEACTSNADCPLGELCRAHVCR